MSTFYNFTISVSVEADDVEMAESWLMEIPLKQQLSVNVIDYELEEIE